MQQSHKCMIKLHSHVNYYVFNNMHMMLLEMQCCVVKAPLEKILLNNHNIIMHQQNINATWYLWRKMICKQDKVFNMLDIKWTQILQNSKIIFKIVIEFIGKSMPQKYFLKILTVQTEAKIEISHNLSD